MFEEVRKQKYYLQIVNQIRDLIKCGNLKRGDMLPSERVLSQEFGASRPVVREALSALETLGIVERKQGQGDFIKVDASEASLNSQIMRELLQEHNPYDIFQARTELEPSMAGLAAEHANEEDILKMQKRLKTMNSMGKEALKNHLKFDEFMEEDRLFHLEIARAAHNTFMFDVFACVNLMMRETRWKALKKISVVKEGRIERFEKEHKAIFEAIRNRDPDVAKRIMRIHIKSIGKDLFG